jgi:L-rhamnose isomerase/sugar isomerase
VKLWFSDGTNYPGQDDITERQERLAVALAETYDRLGEDQRILLEYKLFAELRADMGLDPDPVAAYAGSGYQEKINTERTGGQQAGWEA